ncbi:MAG TPA: hypothetical protein VMJ34_11365 [Bryobacteraceae bacterium]|nr:hypothetical protein [Bryobacteraceae bacterium]
MLVRIRLGQGRRVKQNKPEVRVIATGLSVLLQPVVLAAFVLAAWRFGTDLGWTQDFVISSGPLSHWQTWLAIALVLQAVVIALNRYGNAKPQPPPETPARESVLKSQFDRVL